MLSKDYTIGILQLILRQENSPNNSNFSAWSVDKKQQKYTVLYKVPYLSVFFVFVRKYFLQMLTTRLNPVLGNNKIMEKTELRVLGSWLDNKTWEKHPPLFDKETCRVLQPPLHAAVWFTIGLGYVWVYVSAIRRVVRASTWDIPMDTYYVYMLVLYAHTA